MWEKIFSMETFYAILAVGATTAVIANTVASVRLGRGTRRTASETEALNTISLKDARIAEMQSTIDKLTATVTQDGKDIAVLQKDNARLEALNANKNPELETLMTQVIEALTKQTTAINALLARPVPASTTIVNK